MAEERKYKVVEIEEKLKDEARMAALATGRTLRQFVEDAIRKELEGISVEVRIRTTNPA